MAAILQPRFPIPDRSKQTVHLKKDEDGVLDIGWCEGVLSDGRPFRAEMWAQDGISSLTIFFSALELESDPDLIVQFAIDEGLVAMRRGAEDYISARLWADDAGRPVWSVNAVVGDEDETFMSHSVPIFPLSHTGEPNTMFNPVPISAAHKKGLEQYGSRWRHS